MAGTLVLMVAPLYGQIEIDWTEIPQEIGASFSHNGAESAIVELGSPGGPQSWDFTLQPMGSQNTDVIIVPRTSTPFGDSFPNSNLVLEIAESGYLAYAYAQITPSYGANLGLGSTVPVTAFFRFEPPDSYPLPIIYGANRHYEYGYTLEISPVMEVRTDSYGSETIDAYGTVTVPYGTFECLRRRQFDTTISIVYVGGIPISADTSNRITYDFLAENSGLIARVASYPGETDTNFTDADLLERITDFSTGIDEFQNAVVHHFSCQPNPFTHETRIRYTIHDPGYTIEELRSSHFEMPKPTIEIYDINGRLVKEFLLPTTYFLLSTVVSWDGRDQNNHHMPAGVYFARIGDGGNSMSMKITLVR